MCVCTLYIFGNLTACFMYVNFVDDAVASEKPNMGPLCWRCPGNMPFRHQRSAARQSLTQARQEEGWLCLSALFSALWVEPMKVSLLCPHN